MGIKKGEKVNMGVYKKIFKTIVFTAMLSSPFSITHAGEEDLKIGFVDFEKVFNNFKKTREENQKLQRYKEEKEKEAQSHLEEINRLKAESEILSPEARESTQKKIRQKLRDLRDYTEDSKKELLDERNIIFKKITDDIREVIRKMGEDGNFTLILDDKALFYKKSALDMTLQVIEKLNADPSQGEPSPGETSQEKS